MKVFANLTPDISVECPEYVKKKKHKKTPITQ